jgi:hypothetical protein
MKDTTPLADDFKKGADAGVRRVRAGRGGVSPEENAWAE